MLALIVRIPNEVNRNIPTETLRCQQKGTPNLLALMSENISMKYLLSALLDNVVQMNVHEFTQTWYY